MKTIYNIPHRINNLIVVILCLTGTLFSPVFAEQSESEKVKKTFTADQNTVLTIKNKYGTIDVKDWDKNSINLEVIIKTNELSDEKASEILDLIDINISHSENNILAETEFNESLSKALSKHSALNDKNFEIIYNILAPKYIKLDLSNRYGSIYVSENTAASVIDLHYGKLKINKLISADKNSMAEIKLAYSDANIEESAWLKLIMKYSNTSISKSKALITVSKYSKLYLDYGSSLVAESKYDKYKIGELSNFVGSGGYSNFKIDKLIKKLDLETKYTDVTIGTMLQSFEEISIQNEYGGYNIGIASGTSYKLIGYAKYAKIQYPGNAHVNRFQEGGSLRVDGYIGDKSENMGRVKIETRYGSIDLAY